MEFWKYLKTTDWGLRIYWGCEDKSRSQLSFSLHRRASSSKCFPNSNEPKLARMKNRDVSFVLHVDAKISAHNQSPKPFNLSSKLKSVRATTERMKTCHAEFAQAAEPTFSSRRKIPHLSVHSLQSLPHPSAHIALITPFIPEFFF